ncbi:MAG: hypothetical protein ABIV94_03715 [Acidimicrobiales bacterium]
MADERRTMLGQRDIELGRRGRAAFALACASCCAVPVLVVAGVFSAGAVLGVGVAFGGIAVVGLVVHGVISGRVGSTRPVVRISLAASAAVVAVGGLLASQQHLLVLGVTGLAVAALLALADCRGVAQQCAKGALSPR